MFVRLKYAMREVGAAENNVGGKSRKCCGWRNCEGIVTEETFPRLAFIL